MSENDLTAKTVKAPAARFGGKGLNAGIAAAAVLTAAGLALWGFQLSGGLVQTGMRNLDSWGLYITLFMFLVGLSAGGLIISSVPRAFGMKGFGGISKVAVWTSICCTVLAIAFVVVDLGHPARLWELFAYSNLGSPLMWDIIVLGAYLILSIVYLWATLRAEEGKVSAVALRIVSVIALVCAVLVHSVTAWIFGLQQAREFWHTALLAPWFVSSALVCGTALVLAVVIALRRVGYLELDQSNITKMTKMLGAFVVVDLYFFGCDLLTSAFPGGSGAEVVAMLVSGPLAPFFWVEIIGCALAAAVCFAPRLRTNPLIVVASLLAIVGIFCKRVQLLVGGFQIPNLDYAGPATPYTVTGWESGLAGAYQGMVYWPTPLEFGIVLGVVALGVLMLLVGLKYLPLRSDRETR
ncbi:MULTISPECIES: NrfD/PsrC family molybdoenzyme membrane anchor subunit [Gordonibacter]|uniref:Polysulfide reductase n=3 Tax=Gordonibacter urolithinfaciens TaxID=1335613 RepID=A0A6N8IEW9_9ACTN|nr:MULTISPECIES: NrfD/PsrC family molybdoenzyme membrane anchor subunit [Gordonibacter]GKG91385.1 oxidoreductase [Gordonibacter pamelaeae]MDN4469922.1 polysulfide reductase NrfD [Gordonibacter sp. RACS_AR68]MVM54193.1 polysulfide reductase [Gordonibacter urolithinfaciens]MVN14449.1 polysulfide reductase [Gordonibacter urolithinfaciens]MVN37760.1 polysulfide reductase [Gordonibacter urolithinfaciens]